MLKMARIIGGCCMLLLLVSQRPARGDEPVGPTLLEKTTAEEILNRQQYLSTVGLTYHAADTVTVEPLLGVGHEVLHRNISLTAEESAHSITAQAGGRISILEGMYFLRGGQISPLLLPEFRHSAGRNCIRFLGTGHHGYPEPDQQQPDMDRRGRNDSREGIQVVFLLRQGYHAPHGGHVGAFR